MAYNVLIVDDSPAMRSFVRRVLNSSGLAVGRCLEAGDGKEALGVLDREWVDIVLTDLNMPVMDGEQFVRYLGQKRFLAVHPRAGGVHGPHRRSSAGDALAGRQWLRDQAVPARNSARGTREGSECRPCLRMN